MWPEGTLRIGAVVGHRCISVVLATMSTLVVGVKVVHALVIVLVGSSISSRVVAGQNSFLVMFIVGKKNYSQLIKRNY